MELGVSLLTFAANLLLGLFVILKNPKSRTHQLLTLLALQFGTWAMANYFSLHSPTPAQTLFWIRAVMFITAPLGPTLYLLVRTFPNPNLTTPKPIVKLLTLCSLLVMVLAQSPWLFTAVSISNNQISPQPGPGIIPYALLLFCCLIAAFIQFIKRYRSSKGILKLQLKYLIFGLISTFVLAIITNFIIVIFLKASNLVVFGPLFSIILIGSITYAIVKHQLLDIRAIIVRAVAFILGSFVVISLYAAFLFGLIPYLPSLYQNIGSILAAILIAYSFPLIKQAIEHWTNRIFYRLPYSSDELLERLGELLRSTLSLHWLLKGVLSELKVTIQPTFAFFSITTKDGIKNISYGSKNTLSENAIFNLAKLAQDNIVIFDDLEEGHEKTLLRQLNLAIVIPLQVKEAKQGFLLLGDKSSGNSYSQQDISVLEILAPQLSIAIQNALSYEEISQFNQTLKQEVDKATADLKQANQHLQHLDKLKDEFVFIATHELKNPVTAMRGYLSLFQEGSFGEIPEKMKDPINQLQASNQQLVELVNDLLQIARSEANTAVIKTKPLILTPLIDSMITSLKPLADQKQLQLNYLPFPQALPEVMADEQRLKEILNNLISNAIKYSDHGTITIKHDLQPDLVITHVTDQGVGISAADQTKLFTRFYRVEEEAAKGIPGTGLGLFIVKQLVEKMGGKIWVNSEKGVGSTFSFSLPTA